MALMPRLRSLLRRPFSASTVGARMPRPSNRRDGDTVQEDALRAMLLDDPNDARAFDALAELVRRRAAQSTAQDDPLTAPGDEETQEQRRDRAADLAVWALAEEFAGHPRGWYPLLELGRLSLASDPDGAIRRLATAAERDPDGHALAAGLEILRHAGMPVEALGLGVGHWRVREHHPSVGHHLVLAALEADRPFEAKQHLDNLGLHPDGAAVAELRPQLEHAISQHSATQRSTT